MIGTRVDPKLAELYRDRVVNLHAALTSDDPVAQTEAIEILRTLIERITVRAELDAAAVVTQSGANTLIAFNNGGIITINSLTRANLTDADFVLSVL